MQTLFIGQSYIDITFLTDRMPTGDEKHVAHDYAVSFGGNAVTAAFCCARLGIKPELLTSLADDWLGGMFKDMAARYGIQLHARHVRESSLSFIMPNNGKRAIVRCRDDDYLDDFPELDLTGCRGLHVDGHQPHAALHYAKLCREAGIMTSLDGGSIRDNTEELLEFIDVAVVSELFCSQLEKSPEDAIDYLLSRGSKVAAVTLGEKGVIWRETGVDGLKRLAALPVPPEKVIDSNGAGDTFHGAYMYSCLHNPTWTWREHFKFSRAASAHAIQHLGNDASLPTLKDVEKTRSEYEPLLDEAP